MTENSDNGSLIRLNKYLSNAGIATRRIADKYIAQGLIKVNGEVCTEIGKKIDPLTAIVHFEDEKVEPGHKYYLLFNKSKRFTCFSNAIDDSKSIHALYYDELGTLLKAVSPLEDKATGLVLLTNDQALQTKLEASAKNIYHVELDRSISEDDLAKLKQGIEVDGELVLFSEAVFVEGKPHNHIGLETSCHKRKCISKIFLKLGYGIEKLDRVIFANLTKLNLKRSWIRPLTKMEVTNLKIGRY